jgi:hypothetical protein
VPVLYYLMRRGDEAPVPAAVPADAARATVHSALEEAT